MCGRYTNETEFSQIRLLFQATDRTLRPWTPKYNISPSSGPGFEQLIITVDRPGTRQIRLARFWLIPSFWSKPLSALPTSFNARSEDLTRRRLWQGPYEHSRCLVPATGWREFVGASTPKQPYHFRLPIPEAGAPQPFAFAGLASTWTSPEGEVVDSFAILTTAPSEQARAIHDRMPLVIPSELEEAWLFDDDGREQVLESARQAALTRQLEVFPSDPVANNVHYEGPSAVRRIQPTEARLSPKQRSAKQRSAKQQSPEQLSLLDRAPARRGRT